MLQKTSPQVMVDKPQPKSRAETLAPRIARKTGVAIGLAALLIGAAVMLMYSPRRQMEVGDSAVYDYMSQCIVRGQVPYRDVIDSKGPGSLYISAAVMWVGKALGLHDVLAVRLSYVLRGGVM